MQSTCPLWVKSRHLPDKRAFPLPPKADMCSALADVCFGPIASMPGLILTYSLIFSANHSFCDVKHSDAASVRLRWAIDGPEVKPREKKKNEQTNDTGRNRICPAKFMVWSRTD